MTSSMDYIQSFDGLRLRLRRDIIDDAKAVFVISHGMGASIETEQYKIICDGIEAAGYSIYFFDHRGHGKSEGIRGYCGDFREIVNDIDTVVRLAKDENPGKKVFLFGNSMGGITAEVFGCMHPGSVDGFILSVSASCGVSVEPEKPENLTEPISVHGQAPASPELSSNEQAQSRTPAIGYQLAMARYWLHTHYTEFIDPVLIICAENDMHFKPDEAYSFFLNTSSEDKMLKIYGKALHRIYGDKAGPEAVSDIITWLKARS